MSRRSHPSLPVESAFVLQFGSESDPARGRLVGRVEHVASGRSAHFATAREALAFIRWVLTTPGLIDDCQVREPIRTGRKGVSE
jgi:hypothetical protein